jgi:hypothetical protein
MLAQRPAVVQHTQCTTPCPLPFLPLTLLVPVPPCPALCPDAAEWALECLKQLLDTNMQQNLQVGGSVAGSLCLITGLGLATWQP